VRLYTDQRSRPHIKSRGLYEINYYLFESLTNRINIFYRQKEKNCNMESCGV